MNNIILNELPKELGAARWVGTFEDDSPEWHEQRAKGVGGSDAGVLAGLSPWESPYTWAAKRLGKIPNPPLESEPAEWGKRLEPVILQKFVEEHPELTIHRKVGSWHNIERPWQLANPDALYERDGKFGVVEIKTARYEDGWNEKTGDIPAHYRAQVLWYLQTFGFEHAYVAVLFGGSKFRIHEITYNEFEAETNLQLVEAVKKYVDAGELPDYSAPFNSTFQTTRELHPLIDPELDVELGDIFVYYSLALNDEAKAIEHANEMRARVLDAMGNAKRGLYDDEVVVTRQSRNGGTPYLVNKKK